MFIPRSFVVIPNLYPLYRVVIDPGHGGVNLSPRSLHGDRYDTISEKYLSKFVPGAKYRKYEEKRIIV